MNEVCVIRLNIDYTVDYTIIRHGVNSLPYLVTNKAILFDNCWHTVGKTMMDEGTYVNGKFIKKGIEDNISIPWDKRRYDLNKDNDHYYYETYNFYPSNANFFTIYGDKDNLFTVDELISDLQEFTTVLCENIIIYDVASDVFLTSPLFVGRMKLGYPSLSLLHKQMFNVHEEDAMNEKGKADNKQNTEIRRVNTRIIAETFFKEVSKKEVGNYDFIKAFLHGELKQLCSEAEINVLGGHDEH